MCVRPLLYSAFHVFSPDLLIITIEVTFYLQYHRKQWLGYYSGVYNIEVVHSDMYSSICVHLVSIKFNSNLTTFQKNKLLIKHLLQNFKLVPMERNNLIVSTKSLAIPAYIHMYKIWMWKERIGGIEWVIGLVKVMLILTRWRLMPNNNQNLFTNGSC